MKQTLALTYRRYKLGNQKEKGLPKGVDGSPWIKMLLALDREPLGGWPTGIEANSKQSLRCGTEALFIREFRVPFRNPNGWRHVRSQLVNARSHGCLATTVVISSAAFCYRPHESAPSIVQCASEIRSRL
jgi:hypothetical protein